MKEKTKNNLKKFIFILIGFISGISLMSGCGKRELVFEKTVNEQIMQENEQEVQTSDSFQAVNQDVVQTGDDTQVANQDNAQEKVKECYVDICGAVVTPGVYKVYADTRIYEVVLLAGGLTVDAEQSCINQALCVYDGMKLIVPTKAEWEAGVYMLDEQGLIVTTGQELGDLQRASQTENDGMININEATLEELCTLPGVGNTKAESIIAYREQYGKFSSIEDIKKVAGIKEGLFEKIKSKIKV